MSETAKPIATQILEARALFRREHVDRAPIHVYLGRLTFAEFMREVAPMLAFPSLPRSRPVFAGLEVYVVDDDYHLWVA